MKQANFHKHNNVLLGSLKHFTVNSFDEAFRKVNFLNYERFSNVDAEYTDFLNKLMNATNEIAQSKEIRIKNNNQDWFDREFADLIHVREKSFVKFEKLKLQIDEEIYKKSRIKFKN